MAKKENQLTIKAEWSKEWPREEGTYWFYGRWCFGAEVALVTVLVEYHPQLSKDKCWSYYCTYSSSYMSETGREDGYTHPGGKGFWTPKILPELPDEEPEPGPEFATETITSMEDIARIAKECPGAYGRW